MTKIKIGFIGCGKIVQSHHGPEILKLAKRAKISALYDLKEKTAISLKEELLINSEIFESVDDLLKSDIDGVIISTPNNSHFELTMQSLKAGKHVLVEKPMAVNLEEADKMIAAAKASKLHLQVNQTLRYIPVYQRIKQIIDAGTIGEPRHIRCIRASASSPDKGWSTGSNWFVLKKFAGGIIMDIAIHMADMMGWYFGDIADIYAINKIVAEDCEVVDNVSAVMNFTNGATGILELSWNITPGIGLLEIYGSKGAIRLGFNDDCLEVCTDGEKYYKESIQNTKSSQSYFLDGIEGKSNIPNPEEIGRKALAYCEAIRESGEKNKVVYPLINT